MGLWSTLVLPVRNQRAEQGEGEGHGYVALAAPGVGGARPPEAHLLGLADDVAGPDPVAL